jgi:ppGpp synthetase/RelA/SpoT-type nucleotidyltranferase
LSHTKFKFSRTEVDRSGRVLLNRDSSSVDLEKALDLLANWRSAHAFPLNTITMDLRQKVNRVDSKALVVQRLKRTRSILAKLVKEPSMRLTQMQDIGGCRAVVESIAQVYKLQQLYKKSRSHHELVGEDDYITAPKPSGYRSLHLVYRFKSRSRPEYDKLLVEIQLRTRTQHAWATAVETVGVVIGQALKSSEGEQAWLSFFQHAASALAISENAARIPGIQGSSRVIARALSRMIKDLHVRKKLDAYRKALKHTEKLDAKKAGYYLLVLLPDTPELQIISFSKRNAEAAYREYERFERSLPQAHQGRQLSLFPELSDYTGAQAVLIGADSLRSIRESYPNYYLDTKVFLDEIDLFIQRFKGYAS